MDGRTDGAHTATGEIRMQRSRSDARCRLRAAVIAVAVFAASAVATGTPVGATTTVRLSSVAVESTMTALAAPILGLATTPTGKGYWRVGADGGVLTAGAPLAAVCVAC